MSVADDEPEPYTLTETQAQERERAAVEASVAAIVAAEREAVVAWLRARSAAVEVECHTMPGGRHSSAGMALLDISDELDDAADEIERGDHLTAPDPPTTPDLGPLDNVEGHRGIPLAPEAVGPTTERPGRA